jgi:hypothetical protein
VFAVLVPSFAHYVAPSWSGDDAGVIEVLPA